MKRSPSHPGFPATLIALTATCLIQAQDELHSQPIVTTLTGRYIAETGLGSGAKATSATGGLDIHFPLATFGDFELSQGVSYQREQTDFSGFDTFLPVKASPYKGANEVKLTPGLAYKWSDELRLRTGFSAEYSGADSARFGDSITFGGYVMGAYKLSNELTVGAGFAIFERLARATRYLPIAGLDWRINENWHLSSLNGPNLRLSYLWNSGLTLFAQGEFEYRDIRLKDTASLPNGVVRYRSFPLSLGAEWNITDRLSADLFGGAAIAQQYDFTRQDGGSLRKSDEKTAPFGALAMRYRF